MNIIVRDDLTIIGYSYLLVYPHNKIPSDLFPSWHYAINKYSPGYIINPNAYYLIIKKDIEFIAGACILIVNNEAEIRTVVIAEHKRNQGLCSKLFTLLFSLFGDIYSFKLSVLENNKAAIACYKKWFKFKFQTITKTEKKTVYHMGYSPRSNYISKLNFLELFIDINKLTTAIKETKRYASQILLGAESANIYIYLCSIINGFIYISTLCPSDIHMYNIINKYMNIKEELSLYHNLIMPPNNENKISLFDVNISIYSSLLITGKKINFNLYPILNIEDHNGYKIIRDDLLIGGFSTRSLLGFYANEPGNIYGVIWIHSLYLLAEIYSILSANKKLIIFALSPSKSLDDIILGINHPSLTQVVLYEKPNLYHKYDKIVEVKKYIKKNKINVRLYYHNKTHIAKKRRYLEDNIRYSIPISLMLSPPKRLWLLHDPLIYADKVFKKIFPHIEILLMRFSLKEYPEVEGNIYTLPISKYEINIEEQRDLILIKYGRPGDYILNYIGNVDEQIQFIKANINMF